MKSKFKNIKRSLWFDDDDEDNYQILKKLRIMKKRILWN